MKQKSIVRALFVLTVCAGLALMTTGCPSPIATTDATGSITGRVAAPGQADYSGVFVTAELTDGVRSVSVQKMLSGRQASRAVIAARATTDAGGTYTLTGLPPGVYTLSAVSKDGLGKAVTSSVTVSAGSTAQALLMILTQTGQIQGTVTLGDGKDPTGIVAFIAGTSYSAMTDLNGRYLMSYVPAGKNHTLVASRTGYVSEIRLVDVIVNTTRPEAPIVLARYVPPQTTWPVSGTATLSDSMAASAGIFVYLVGTSHICVTNDAGEFSLPGVPRGGYTIMASKEGYSAQSGLVNVPQGNDPPISFTLILIGGGTGPASPTGVSATPVSTTEVAISWSMVEGVSYNLYWSTTPGVTKATGTKVAGVRSPYNHGGLTVGTRYYYAVTAEKPDGESAASSQVSAAPAPFIYGSILALATDETAGGGFLSVLNRNGGSPIADATVKVNGISFPYNAQKQWYMAVGGLTIAKRSVVTLAVTVSGTTYTASATQFSTYPTVTAPAENATWQHGDDNVITWTAGAPTTGATYVAGVLDDQTRWVSGHPDFYSTDILSITVPANTLTPAPLYFLQVGIMSGNGNGTGGTPIPNALPGSMMSVGGVTLVPITVQ
jgi:hypothetical protein